MTQQRTCQSIVAEDELIHIDQVPERDRDRPCDHVVAETQNL
jgi:hypothetical protein